MKIKLDRIIIEPYENQAAEAFREAYKLKTGKDLLMVNPDKNAPNQYILATGNNFGGYIDENGIYHKVLTSDQENAFQHAYLGSYISYEKGEAAVQAFGELKELGTLIFLNDYDWGDHNRDFKNNNLGINIAESP